GSVAAGGVGEGGRALQGKNGVGRRAGGDAAALSRRAGGVGRASRGRLFEGIWSDSARGGDSEGAVCAAVCGVTVGQLTRWRPRFANRPVGLRTSPRTPGLW